MKTIRIDILNYVKDTTIVYIQIYEGDKSGIGKVTSKGYQRNLKSKYYLSFIENIFKDYNIKCNGNIFEVFKEYDKESC